MSMFNDISALFSRLFKIGNEYVVPVVSSVGNGAKGDTGPMGPQGPQGPKGDPGDGSAIAAEAAARAAQEAAENAANIVNDMEPKIEQTESYVQIAAEKANQASVYLSDIERVVDVVTWVAEHGEYVSQADQVFDPMKTYFTRTGEGTSESPYVYTPVLEPVAQDIDSYYLLRINESVQSYIASYLYLVDNGLHVRSKDTDYEICVSSNGVTISEQGKGPVASFDNNGIQIGRNGEMRVMLTPNRFAFVDENDNETAYIEMTNEGFSVLCINRAVVVESMQFGNWKWYSRANGNMALKWVGEVESND